MSNVTPILDPKQHCSMCDGYGFFSDGNGGEVKCGRCKGTGLHR